MSARRFTRTCAVAAAPLLLLLAPPTPAWGQPAPQILDESKFTEVVNRVAVVIKATKAESPAKIGDVLKAPDFVQTGRRSRAQLLAGDGTITRVGSNSVFAFDQQSRTIYLKKGNLLFNSPEGKGGGKVVTYGATATVLGTTLMISATGNGGFKVLVIEGRAQIKFANGQVIDLTAGQMTFVQPDGPADVEPPEADPTEPADTPEPEGFPGPVLEFDLEATVEGSALINGFEEALPSRAQIDDAIVIQQGDIQDGTLVKTETLIIETTGEGDLVTIDTSKINKSNEVRALTPQQRLAAALARTAVLTSPNLPADFVFPTPVNVMLSANPAPGLALLARHNPHQGLIAGGIVVRTNRLDFRALDQVGSVLELAAADLFASDRTLTVEGLTRTRALRLLAGRVVLAPGTDLVANFAAGPTSTFAVTTEMPLTLDANGIVNDSGHVFLTVDAGGVDAVGGLLSAGGGNLRVEAIDIAMSNVALEATVQAELRGSDIVINGGTVDAQVLRMSALSGLSRIDLRNTGFSAGLASVGLEARTINLENIAFPGGSVVNLASRDGLLAPGPNTGQVSVTGLVNFINNVTYSGQPAQRFVPAAQFANPADAVNLDPNPMINISRLP